MPDSDTFPLVQGSPIASDTRSLSKFTSYSYTDDEANTATLDVASFSSEGFPDFQLDLSCLTPSPPPSPTPPPSDYPYLPSSPPSSSRRSVSFSASPSPVLGKSSSVPRLGTTSPRISLISPTWSHSHYVGRGTPIDRGRLGEWGGSGIAEDVVGEDGVLFSTVRSTSIDSAAPQSTHRSISPLVEWNYISPPPTRSRRSTVSLSPLPESVKIHLTGVNTDGSDSSAEWASSTEKVLASPSSVEASALSQSTPAFSSSDTHYESAADEPRTPDDTEGPSASTHVDVETNNQLDPDPDPALVSLSAAVDQGLGLTVGAGGMTWFDAGILPRADSPSIYSCDDQPPLAQSHDSGLADVETHDVPLRARRSISKSNSKSHHTQSSWWQRLLARLRAVVLRRRRQRRV